MVGAPALYYKSLETATTLCLEGVIFWVNHTVALSLILMIIAYTISILHSWIIVIPKMLYILPNGFILNGMGIVCIITLYVFGFTPFIFFPPLYIIVQFS